jgi:hypothetical protein
VEAREQVAHPADGRGFVFDQRGSVSDQEAELDFRFFGQLLPAQVIARHDLFSDDLRITRVGLVLATPGATAGSVHRQAGHVNTAEVAGQQHGSQQPRDAAKNVQTDAARAVFALEGVEFADGLRESHRLIVDSMVEQDETAVIDDRQPVELLGDVEAGVGGQDRPRLALQRAARLLPSVLALPSDGPQSLISSPEEVAGQGDQPPEPSRAASVKTIPVPLAQSQSRELPGRTQEGRAV